MKKQIEMIGSLALALLLHGADHLAPPKVVFSGSVVQRDAKGTNRRLHITIRDWRLDANEVSPQIVAMPVFSVVTLRSGRIETTIGTQTAIRRPEDFWSGTAGSVMKVKVLSQSAIIRVIEVVE
jgi:hypothetical protein